MRLFSWAGGVALAAAAAGGFVAGGAVHRRDVVPVIRVCNADGGELSEAPPTPVVPPQVAEDIDLTCQSAAFGPQSTEPPLADQMSASMIRTASFELPAGSPDGPESPQVLPVMPYLTDDPTPAKLPPLDDVPAGPQPAPDNPLFRAVKKFVETAVTPPRYVPDPTERLKSLINQSEDLREAGVNDRPSPLPAADKVDLGKPPVCEHPSAAPLLPPWFGRPPKPPGDVRVPRRLVPLPVGDVVPRPKVDTTEVRPGDLP
ncbi:MAG TPA: hypothetical protein VGF55_32215, partial [Gemmataceae bacterium]